MRVDLFNVLPFFFWSGIGSEQKIHPSSLICAFVLIHTWVLVFRPPDITLLGPARHVYILCKICQHICRQMLLLVPGGGAILYKAFPNFYIKTVLYCKSGKRSLIQTGPPKILILRCAPKINIYAQEMISVKT